MKNKEQTEPEDILHNWAYALAAGKLTEEQRKVLEDMVSAGQAETVEEAARLLDWQTEALEQTSSMWGP